MPQACILSNAVPGTAAKATVQTNKAEKKTAKQQINRYHNISKVIHASHTYQAQHSQQLPKQALLSSSGNCCLFYHAGCQTDLESPWAKNLAVRKPLSWSVQSSSCLPCDRQATVADLQSAAMLCKSNNRTMKQSKREKGRHSPAQHQKNRAYRKKNDSNGEQASNPKLTFTSMWDGTSRPHLPPEQEILLVVSSTKSSAGSLRREAHW